MNRKILFIVVIVIIVGLAFLAGGTYLRSLQMEEGLETQDLSLVPKDNELTVSYVKTLIEQSDKANLLLIGWLKNSESFVFGKYALGENCFAGICGYTTHEYNVDSDNQKSYEGHLSDSAISPDGKVEIITIYPKNPLTKDYSVGAVIIKDAETDEIVKVLGIKTTDNGGPSLTHLVWSPNGKFIAFIDASESGLEAGLEDAPFFFSYAVKVISASATNLSEAKTLGSTFLPDRAYRSRGIYWSPDSKKFFAYNKCRIFSVENMEELYRPLVSVDNNRSKASCGDFGYWLWSPDSEKILVVNRQNLPGFADIFVMDYSGNVVQDIAYFKPETADRKLVFSFNAAWAPNGERIVYSDGNGLYVISLNRESEKQKIFDGVGNYENILWSPDSKKIAFKFDDQIQMISFE